MEIPVLLNPFGAERSTRQRLLNAVQQIGDNILSQQVLMTITASTLATKTPLPQCHELNNAPGTATEVSPSENVPPEFFGK